MWPLVLPPSYVNKWLKLKEKWLQKTNKPRPRLSPLELPWTWTPWTLIPWYYIHLMHLLLRACSFWLEFLHNSFTLLASGFRDLTLSPGVILACTLPATVHTCTLSVIYPYLKLILFMYLNISFNNTLWSNYLGSFLGIQTPKAVMWALKHSVFTYSLSNLSFFRS